MGEIVTTEQILRVVPAEALADGKLSEAIWKILCSKGIRKSRNGDINGDTESMHLRQIQHFIDLGEPIRIVFIGWPFKMWRNPLKTDRKIPDLGELAFVRQLVSICLSVSTVYPPGLKWTVLTEGKAYGELFEVEDHEWQRYLKRMKYFVGLYDADSMFEIGCLATCLENFPEFPRKFQDVMRGLEEEFSQEKLESIWNDPYRSKSRDLVSDELGQAFHTMLRSIDTQSVSVGDHLIVYGKEGRSPEGRHIEMRHEWARHARILALKYLAYNIAKNEVGERGAIQDSHPHHLYVSITRKKGRFAFHPIHNRVGRFPHHGVPVMCLDGVLRIHYLYQVKNESDRFQPVFFDDDIEEKPFYYQEV